MAKDGLNKKNGEMKDISGLSYGLARVGQIGFNIAIPILIAILAGRYLDNRFFPDHYILTLILPLFGGFFSMWYVYKTAMIELNKEISAADAKEKENKKNKAI